MESAAAGRRDSRWDQRSTLEQKVGRQRTSGGLTLAEQIERFPQLASAPRAGSSNAAASARSMVTTGMHFQPLGTTIRHVRCVRCGQWGHQVGDRECSMRSGALNANDMATLRREDPMPDSMMASLGHSKVHAKQAGKPCAGDAVRADGAVAADGDGGGGAGAGAGAGTGAEAEAEAEEGRSSPSIEAEFIASLSKKDRKLLLRHLGTIPDAGAGVGGCGRGEHERKRKHKKRTHEHRRKRKRKKLKKQQRGTEIAKSRDSETDSDQ